MGLRVSGLRLLYFPSRMENQMQKNMENEMETAGIYRFLELNLSYYTKNLLYIYIYPVWRLNSSSLTATQIRVGTLRFQG